MWEIASPLAGAGGVYDGVCFVLFPRNVLNENLDLNGMISGGFPKYSFM